MPGPRVVVLRAPGTNCDEETVHAWEKAGARAETIHVNRLIEAPRMLREYQILTLPGGFSYGDDLGAGRVLASKLGRALGDQMRAFHDQGGLVIGICNGFQVLVRSGLLPGGDPPVTATLAHNESGRFEARWVTLAPLPGKSPFVTFAEPIELPVSHGEGCFLTEHKNQLDHAGQVVLQYADEAGRPTERYPANPNGSPQGTAGVCDPSGRIFGLMPHPERFVESWHHPRWTRARHAPAGLLIFQGAVAALA